MDSGAQAATARDIQWVRALIRDGKLAAIRGELSQTELGELIGVNRAAVSRWETGDRVPRGENAIRLARVLRGLLGD
jgi:DNA-binding XRE family transcriptional regulator